MVGAAAAMFLSLQLLSLGSAAVVNAQLPQRTNISMGSSLSTTTNGAASWLSPSGRFAFGFYPVEGGGFNIGIWLSTTPQKTIVWTASRDDPPIIDGTVRLSFDGRLLWSAPGGLEKPISQATEPGAFASMFDSGNFVLYNSQNRIVWSTFDSPTDTLLAGQSLAPGNQLISSSSESDRSTGKFRLKMQNDGNLVLYPTETTDTAVDAYWDTGTFMVGFPVTLQLSTDRSMALSGNNGTIVKNLTQADQSSSRERSEVYYRATLDADGIFRLYSHRFESSNGSSTTSVEWEVLKDRCLVKGTCGLNSYCNSITNGETNCLCPPGFDFIDPQQRLLGCVRNFTGGGGCGGFSIATMENTYWVDQPYSIPSSTSAEDCKASCSEDCFCVAALFNGGQCTKQVLPLRYGRKSQNNTAFVKVGAIIPHENSPDGFGQDQKKKKVSVGVLIICVAFAVCLVIAIAISGFLIYRHRRVKRYVKTLEEKNSVIDEENPTRSFSYQELERATDGFKEEVGKGSFGTVFKGVLSNSEKIVAVKRLDKMVEDGEREFQREVRAIGRTHHRNLVGLLGFCNEGSSRLLVYEYMSNGSLANLLFKAETIPSWEERVRIALDVARGLHYLHEDVESRIIHCDIKPQNILMDSSRTAKISDFGLAKLLMPDQTKTFTGIRGTRGYLAPEWYKNSPISVKTDVYSFGIVLLEIVCCRRSMELEEAGCGVTLAEWVFEFFKAGEWDRLLYGEDINKAELERMVMVGMWCAQYEPASRPSMKNVILMLEGNMQVSAPPPPTSLL